MTTNDFSNWRAGDVDLEGEGGRDDFNQTERAQAKKAGAVLDEDVKTLRDVLDRHAFRKRMHDALDRILDTHERGCIGDRQRGRR